MTALIEGERDPVVLAEMAQRKLRRKIPALIDALEGRFTEHQAFMMRLFLKQVDGLDEMITQLEVRIDEAMVPYADAAAAIATIPGLLQTTAQVIIAEIGWT